MLPAAAGPRGRLLSTYRVLKQPLPWLLRWQRSYGDPFFLPAMNGDVFVTGQPELVKQIFAHPSQDYSAFATKALGGFAGPGSMLAIDGERHRRERKLLTPPFRGSHLKKMGPAMFEAALRGFEAATRTGPLKFGDLAQDITLEVIIRTIFGVQSDARVRVFVDAVLRYLHATNPLLLFFPATHHRWFPPWTSFRSSFMDLDALLQEQIESARDHDTDDNILSAMLTARYEDGTAMSDDDIKDELRTLLFAGHDTTAITLTWVVDHLYRDPALVERLHREVDRLDHTPDAYASNTTLENLWKEALRLHPVVTEVLRTVESPMQLGPVTVPKGLGVAASIVLVHYNPELYPDPTRFDIDRFARRRFGAHEYLPFGGGHRRCLGAAFAGFQLQIVLGVLLRGFQVRLLDPRAPQPIRRSLTLAPDTGVPAVVERRSASPLAS